MHLPSSICLISDFSVSDTVYPPHQVIHILIARPCTEFAHVKDYRLQIAHCNAHTGHCFFHSRALIHMFMCAVLNALLPSWSPFGDFGPNGDQNEFFGPHFFFKVPIFSISGLRTRQKSVQPLSNVNHLITCVNKIL